MTSAFSSVVVTSFAFVYADPGSGMLLWQLITAAALGLLFYARTIVRKIRGLIGSSEDESRSHSNTE
jgi:hypothetical protein